VVNPTLGPGKILLRDRDKVWIYFKDLEGSQFHRAAVFCDVGNGIRIHPDGANHRQNTERAAVTTAD
jgi:hypothetical protein